MAVRFLLAVGRLATRAGARRAAPSTLGVLSRRRQQSSEGYAESEAILPMVERAACQTIARPQRDVDLRYRGTQVREWGLPSSWRPGPFTEQLLTSKGFFRHAPYRRLAHRGRVRRPGRRPADARRRRPERVRQRVGGRAGGADRGLGRRAVLRAARGRSEGARFRRAVGRA